MRPDLAELNRSRRRSIKDRFEEKHMPEPNSGCWIWLAGTTADGYGRLEVGYADTGFYVERAHRVSYQLYCDEIPEGMHVLHKCDNPTCVNPSHLFLGTTQINTKDRDSKGRQCRGLRHWSKTTPEKLRRGKNHYTHYAPDLAPRGESQGNSKLTENRVLQILLDRRASHLVGKDHGVSGSTIRNIRQGKIWSWLTKIGEPL